MKNHHSSIIPKISLLLAPLLFLSEVTSGQTTPITGNLTVTGSIRAGANDYGGGTRLFWNPTRSAFRAGKVDSTQWDLANLAPYSAAFGHNTCASGVASTAFGIESIASGSSSTAMGIWTVADGDSSVATGHATMALGESSTVSGNSTVATGWGASANGYGTLGMGRAAVASGSFTSAIGDYSTSMGTATVATSFASVAIGQFNIGGGDPLVWSSPDPVFEIGNGTPDTTEYDLEGNVTSGEPEVRSNALTVYKNGNMDVQGNIEAGGVVTCAPGGDIPMFTGN